MTSPDDGPGDVAVLVPAAGVGARLGPGVPKALRLLRNEPLLGHSVRRLAAARSVGCLVVAAPPGHEPAVREVVAAAVATSRRAPAWIVVTGGVDRPRSVALALAAAPAGFDLVLVHDAARALIPPSLVDRVADAVRAGHDAVIPVVPVTDTVVQVGSGATVVATPDRATLRAVQTPQGFRRSVLSAAHAAYAQVGTGGGAVTDDAGLVVRLGRPVHTVPGAELAMKITLPVDFQIAAGLLAAEAASLTGDAVPPGADAAALTADPAGGPGR